MKSTGGTEGKEDEKDQKGDGEDQNKEEEKGTETRHIFEVEGDGKERMNGYFVCFLLIETRKSSSI